MIGDFLFSLGKRLYRRMQKQPQPLMVLRVGDTLVGKDGDTVKLLEVHEHYIRGERDGRQFMRSRRGFTKHYQPIEVAITCPHCKKLEGVFMYDVPVYQLGANADSQQIHRKYGCRACDKVWTMPKPRADTTK